MAEEGTVIHMTGFPRDLHRTAKAMAAMEGISLKELIIKAVREYLERKGGGPWTERRRG